MKNILNYYYRIIIDDNNINDKGYFSYDDHLFCLYEYKRNINEIEPLNNLNKLMLSKGININKIISNIFNQAITYHDNKNYSLIMINYEYSGKFNKFIKAIEFKEFNILKRNDWSRLWGTKVDYIEYQLSHISNQYPLLNDSVNYYIGLAENAITYFNMLDLNNVELYISHRRINKESIYNPLELILDYKVRDIGEYIKQNFFYKNMSIYEIKNYLGLLNLNNMDYILLYVRLLYPSYYFDVYDKIINENEDEKEINKIIELNSLYEELLYEIYALIRKKINILGIDWINKKYM